MDAKMKMNRGQVTVFIIIAIILITIVALFFAFRGEKIEVGNIPASLSPVYASFLSCLEQKTLVGVDILESQGGYIYVPDFEPGSDYMPFSSQLDFLGNPVPYWYYVSANNIQKQQMPSKKEMQAQLGAFVEERIRDCDYSDYYGAGVEIDLGTPLAKVSILGEEIEVDLKMGMGLTRGEDSVFVEDHKVLVSSKLGKLYDSAKLIYEEEQKNLFLESYAVDTLHSYVPVDGVEISCGPKTWNAEEVFDDLEKAIEANTLALKSSGAGNDYFVVKGLSIDPGVEVSFFNSRNWPHAFEVTPSESVMMLATPVGNQPGLGALGFCYVPYHFVYNVKYPVLIQVSSGIENGQEEIFQFPVAVVLQGNNPRQPLIGDASGIEVPELCGYKNNRVRVNVFDNNLRSIDADVSYECFSETCYIGKSVDGSLDSSFPQCVNGFVVVRAEGYKEKKQMLTTTKETSIDVSLEKLYELGIDLTLDGNSYSQNALVSFTSEDYSVSAFYPEQKSVKLAEGQYEVQVHIYRDSSLKLSELTYEECTEIPRSGIGGILGFTKEKCFEVSVPAQDISNALAGGGKQNYYLTESELEGASFIEIDSSALPVPRTLEELQNNYLLFEGKGLGVGFK